MVSFSNWVSLVLQVQLLASLGVASKFVVLVNPGSEVPQQQNFFPYQIRKRFDEVSPSSGLKEGKNVCETKIWKDHKPSAGHLHNGSAVEIEPGSLIMTVVECVGRERHQCNGINHKEYASECFTHHEYYKAPVRLLGSESPFVEGLLKVPIACMCRVRRLGTLFRK